MASRNMGQHKKSNGRDRTTAGFSLIELMIVVFIIGVLASVAIPAFARYMKRARTVEASGHLNRIAVGAVAYFHAPHPNADGTLLGAQFPATAGAYETPADCCAGPGLKCPGDNAVYDAPTWVALGFAIGDPHFYAPYYSAGNVLTGFTARAHGDQDCDGIHSLFERFGTVNSEKDVALSAGVYHMRETE